MSEPQATPSPHVAIDMRPLRQPLVSYNRTRSQQSTASYDDDTAASTVNAYTTEARSRSRSRSRSGLNANHTATSSEHLGGGGAVAAGGAGGDHHRQASPRNARPKRQVQLAETDGEPLLVSNGGDVEIIPRARPPIVHPETENDDDDDDEKDPNTTTNRRHHPQLPNHPLAPHPGVDEGFFPNTASEADDGGDSAVPPSSHRGSGADDEDDTFDGPRLTPRRAGDNGDNGDMYPSRPVSPFPMSPGLDGVSTIIVPDVNVYQQKKTLAQGMMDLALLSANANQLRYVLEAYNNHPYFYPSIVFIAMSIILQISVGVGLILNSRYNVKDKAEICKADRINNYTVIGIFLITTVNVFITSFGVASRETSNMIVPASSP